MTRRSSRTRRSKRSSRRSLRRRRVTRRAARGGAYIPDDTRTVVVDRVDDVDSVITTRSPNDVPIEEQAAI